jgi:hypothetical protein
MESPRGVVCPRGPKRAVRGPSLGLHGTAGLNFPVLTPMVDPPKQSNAFPKEHNRHSHSKPQRRCWHGPDTP